MTYLNINQYLVSQTSIPKVQRLRCIKTINPKGSTHTLYHNHQSQRFNPFFVLQTSVSKVKPKLCIANINPKVSNCYFVSKSTIPKVQPILCNASVNTKSSTDTLYRKHQHQIFHAYLQHNVQD